MSSLVAHSVKKKKNSMSAMQETWAQHLDKENPLEKEMATQSSILAWKIPWTEESATVYGITKSWTGLSN